MATGGRRAQGVGHVRDFRRSLPALGLLVVLVGACSQPAPSPAPTVSGSPSPAASPSPSLLACVPAQPPVAAPAGVVSQFPVLTLAGGLSSPDDILFDGDRVLVGEQATGRIAAIGRGGVTRLPGLIPAIEGIARSGDTLFVGDQPNDRVVMLAPDGTVRTFLQLQPVRGVDGLDNIRFQGGSLLVPDSARGQLLVVGLDGAVQRTVAGFARPVDAFLRPDGSILVADENAAGIWEVATDGSKRLLVRNLPLADDVVVDGQGRVYTILINGGTVVQVAADGSQAQVVRGIGQPQGLELDGAANLLVTDFNRGLLLAVVTSFKLAPPGEGVVVGANQPLCLAVVRAPGFTEDVKAMPGQGYRVVGPLEVVPDRCGRGECEVAVTVGGRSGRDTVWVRYSGG